MAGRSKVTAPATAPILRPLLGSNNVDGEAIAVLLMQLRADLRPEHQRAMLAQVVVEIPECRHERQNFDRCRQCPVGQNAKRRVACSGAQDWVDLGDSGSLTPRIDVINQSGINAQAKVPAAGTPGALFGIIPY